MRSSARPLSEDFTTAPLWGTLLRSWLRVLIAAGLVGGMVFAALSFVPPRYSATAELRVQTASGVHDDAAAESKAAAAMIEALRSRHLAGKLMAELAETPDGELVPNDLLGILTRSGGFPRKHPGETTNDVALMAFYRSLRVGHDAQAHAITIEFSATTPDLAVRAANRLAELYLAQIGGSSASPATPTAPAHQARIEKLIADIQVTEAAIERARRDADPSVRAQWLRDLAEAVRQAYLERGDAETRARTVRALLDKGQIEAISEVQSSPTLHELSLERVRIEVQKTAAERAPAVNQARVRELQAKLSEIRWRMFREATGLADALDAEARSASQREAEARARLESAGAESGDTKPENAALLAELEREVATRRTTLEALQAQASAENSALSTAARSQAVPSPGPVFPRKGPLALLAAVSTLLAGFIIVIFRQLLNSARRVQPGGEFVDLIATARDRVDGSLSGRPSDVRDIASPELQMPEPANVDTGTFVIVSTPDDAARHIASRAAGRSGYRTLLVGDGVEGAGEARELATALATSGRRCVLVDWSPEGTGVAATLGLPTQPGINDLLSGRATFDDAIIRLPDSDAHFIACGAPAAGSALDVDWVSLVLDALDEAYDHIVVVSQMVPARALFEAIEGRFDAGVVMSERLGLGMNIHAAPGVFLGFEVTEICVVQMDLVQKRAAAPRRLKRGRRLAVA
jgi:uncharacterized protein involved in exopolysaccharide biosynthesis